MGGVDEESKINWVKWSDVCKPKDHGGLGIKDWRLFNMALLGKWQWRFLSEPDNLWCRVVEANCNTCGESSWWKEVKATSLEGGWNWFQDSLHKTVFEGNATKFWDENWLEVGSLGSRFRRLYNLSCQKREAVTDMGQWENGVWRWTFRWRRGLQGREVAWLEELLEILRGARLVEGKKDSWAWKLDGRGNYTVNSSYVFLQEQFLLEPDPVFQWIWATPVPSNIKAFAWRAVLGRLQTRDNLLKRQVISDAEEARCALCRLEVESGSHLLFSCSETLPIWYDCCAWMGVCSAQVTDPSIHLLQFPVVGRSKSQRLAETAVWMATVWSIWCARNRVIFNGGALDRTHIFEQVQIRAWQWLTARVDEFFYSWYEWKINPNECLRSL